MGLHNPLYFIYTSQLDAFRSGANLSLTLSLILVVHFDEPDCR